MRWFEKDLEIRYADTDRMDVVHHAVYPVYCELSRIDLLDQIGLPYTQIEEAGYYLMVSDIQCRFKLPVRFGDRVYIRGRINTLRSRLINFDYEIRGRESDELRFTATSKHLVTARTNGVVSLPREFMAKLRAAVD
ncbi:MAG: thioesterase family protein [Acidobacteriota bacterium]|nr:thioesterase family protein [Acidobacteriota bacterium]